MANKDTSRSSGLLRWVVTLTLLAVIVYQVYLGITVQKIGIPGIFQIDFGVDDWQHVATVSAQGGWQSAGFDLKPGKSVKIEASGTVRYSNRNTAPGKGFCGAEGVPPVSDPVGGHKNDFRQYSIVPEWNHAALIARVGSDAVVLVGRSQIIQSPQGGTLEFTVNDTDGANNGGELTVVVSAP
jgi:hypothetical protein